MKAKVLGVEQELESVTIGFVVEGTLPNRVLTLRVLPEMLEVIDDPAIFGDLIPKGRIKISLQGLVLESTTHD